MDVAYALQKSLEYESDPTVWDQGVKPVRQVWSHAFTYLAPLNQADEAWNPLPIAQLDREWRKDAL